MPHPKDLVAASATPLVLSILERGDSYGYAILAEVREASGGDLDWAEGMLYPILHRLEDRGHVTSYWGKSDAGRRRKYYRIEPQGRTRLAELRASWDRLHTLLQSMGPGSVPNTQVAPEGSPA